MIPNSELAGFSVSERCKCTGSNSVPGLGTASLGLDYGVQCFAHDSNARDCANIWPKCIPGPWCCKSW